MSVGRVGATGGRNVIVPLSGPPAFQSPEESFTVPISLNAATDNTVRAAVVDRRWVITKLVLVLGATGTTVTIKSGSIALTGAMPFPANTILDIGDGDRPILRADNVNEAFVVTLADAVDVMGWAQMREVGQR